MTVTVSVPGSSYDVITERGILKRVGEHAKLDRRVLVVTDSGVPEEYARTVMSQCARPVLVTLPEGEKNKTLASFAEQLRKLLEKFSF